MTQTHNSGTNTFTDPGIDLEPGDLDDLFTHAGHPRGSVGRSEERKDARDKVLGRARYTDDLCPANALWIKIMHATIAHGHVTAIDTSYAERIPGVVAVFTCFDVPDRPFPTAGHPWSTDPGHQDVADRLLLNKHVRYWGDEIAVVVAETELAAKAGVAAMTATYDELPFALNPHDAMADGAALLHDEYPGNVLAHTRLSVGNYDEAIKEPGLVKIEGTYDTGTVQHCHIENHICFAEAEGDRITVTTSTQIPHIVRRVVGQALGIGWGKIRVVKPYIGGGFGNKQDVLLEPLCAWVCTKVGGRTVKLDTSREETFVSQRVRHAMQITITSWVRPDGTFAARKYEAYSDQGGYASHGHSIAAKGMNCFHEFYQCPNVEADSWTVYTNKPTSGAMRGYGIPQAMWAGEGHIDDICRELGYDPYEFRLKNIMPNGYVNAFSHNENYSDSPVQTLVRGAEAIDYRALAEKHAQQDAAARVRRGVGMAAFWYNTGVWPISLESSACRMVLAEDGSVSVSLGETEIGQGGDTAFAQMTADAVGVPYADVHVVSTQDTDVAPFGTGAYASRQTYVAGFAIRQTGDLLREKILAHAHELTRMPVAQLDLVDGRIVRTTDGRAMMTLGELSTEVIYSMTHSEHIAAESTYQIKSNAYSFGCSFAEVEVDIDLCQAKLLRLINVHDAGTLINPALAEAQVHGGQSMSIGLALQEELLFDAKNGKPLNNNLLDYKLCTSVDHPDLEALFIENAEPTSAFGTKALGEPPTCSPAPAIRNAILAATGVPCYHAPITPHQLFRRFTEAGLIGESSHV
jgi:xanthine dehydrogenase molybdenum-binding subunit